MSKEKRPSIIGMIEHQVRKEKDEDDQASKYSRVTEREEAKQAAKQQAKEKQQEHQRRIEEAQINLAVARQALENIKSQLSLSRGYVTSSVKFMVPSEHSQDYGYQLNIRSLKRSLNPKQRSNRSLRIEILGVESWRVHLVATTYHEKTQMPHDPSRTYYRVTRYVDRGIDVEQEEAWQIEQKVWDAIRLWIENKPEERGPDYLGLIK